jgi:hypothetical protein
LAGFEESEPRASGLLPSPENSEFQRYPNWSQELVDEFLCLEPPEEPFEIGPGNEVWVPAWYFKLLRLDCELGPTGPRARNGALNRDLENLLKALKIENGKCKPLKLLLSDSHAGQSSKKWENKVKRKSHPKERTEDFSALDDVSQHLPPTGNIYDQPTGTVLESLAGGEPSPLLDHLFSAGDSSSPAAQECGTIFLEARERYKTGYQMTPALRLQERAIANIRNRVSQGQDTLEDFRDAVRAWEELIKSQRGVKK